MLTINEMWQTAVERAGRREYEPNERRWLIERVLDGVAEELRNILPDNVSRVGLYHWNNDFRGSVFTVQVQLAGGETLVLEMTIKIKRGERIGAGRYKRFLYELSSIEASESYDHTLEEWELALLHSNDLEFQNKVSEKEAYAKEVLVQIEILKQKLLEGKEMLLIDVYNWGEEGSVLDRTNFDNAVNNYNAAITAEGILEERKKEVVA